MEKKIVLSSFAIFGILITQTNALSCYQCNIFIRGSPWPCESERGMKEVSGCYACLKTFTRTYLHNTFHDELYTKYESRLCVKSRDYIKEEGCHPHETSSGYMKRCFCYSDFCNSSTRVHLTMALSSLCLSLALFLKRMM